MQNYAYSMLLVTVTTMLIEKNDTMLLANYGQELTFRFDRKCLTVCAWVCV